MMCLNQFIIAIIISVAFQASCQNYEPYIDDHRQLVSWFKTSSDKKKESNFKQTTTVSNDSNMISVNFNDNSNPCNTIFETPKLRSLCLKDTTICLCNPERLHKKADFGIIIPGSIRTMPVANPSFREFILKANAPCDVVYVIQNYNSNEEKYLQQIYKHATAIMAHNTSVWTSIVDYAKAHSRKVTQNHIELDKIQRNHGRGGLIDMWANIELSYHILKQISLKYNKNYKLIMKTRPDLVYFHHFSFQTLLDRYQVDNYERPFPVVING